MLSFQRRVSIVLRMGKFQSKARTRREFQCKYSALLLAKFCSGNNEEKKGNTVSKCRKKVVGLFFCYNSIFYSENNINRA